MTSKSSSAKIVEISITDAAKRLGLSVQAVGLWAARPGAPSRAEGRRVLVEDPAFFRWRESELQKQAVAEVTGGDYEKERTRKVAAEASLAELTLAREQGALVTVEDYSTALGVVLDRLMARLRSLPPRLAHLGAVVEVEIEKEVERIVTELNGFDEDVLPEPEDEPELTEVLTA